MTELYRAAKYALADLEGIMPELEPSGDRQHSGWKTIEDLRKALENKKGVTVQLTDEQIPLLINCLMGGIELNLQNLEDWVHAGDEEEIEQGKDRHRKYAKLYTNLCYQIELHEEDEDDA